eukprot:TRINITY_DN12478_c4_g7_i4.p5 TRINITY_DN12478_c4_g7~~TRINITY_DN12478_c4_g7_i4.p5  ORF type:complete len:111 (-),score=10.31 TRINITY_DN12478_c4_g7_i4:966-1298(-)
MEASPASRRSGKGPCIYCRYLSHNVDPPLSQAVQTPASKQFWLGSARPIPTATRNLPVLCLGIAALPAGAVADKWDRSGRLLAQLEADSVAQLHGFAESTQQLQQQDLCW